MPTAEDLITAQCWGAIILAGGAGRRLGGRDKGGLHIAGRSLVDRAVSAALAAGVRRPVIVVGPDQAVSAPPETVRFTREEPAGGGPVAALYAGRDALDDSVTGLLVWAVDMPGVDAGVLTGLRARATEAPSLDGAVLCDPDGRRQLAYALTCRALDAARPIRVADQAIHRLLKGVALAEWHATTEQAADIDTEADLEVAITREGESGCTGESARLDR